MTSPSRLWHIEFEGLTYLESRCCLLRACLRFSREVRILVCVYMDVHMCMYIYMHVHIYLHTHQCRVPVHDFLQCTALHRLWGSGSFSD